MTQEQIAAFINQNLIKTTSEITISISSLNDFFSNGTLFILKHNIADRRVHTIKDKDSV